MTAVLSPLRLGRITASRVPKILGLSPHGGPEDVLREMVRDAWGADPEFTGNIATEWGNEHEADGIEEYERATGLLVVGMQEFTIHPSIDWMAMSPDGQIGQAQDEEGDGLVEVKAPFRARYNHWSERPDIASQQQHQMACAQAAWNDLAVWRPYGTSISRNHYDDTWLDFNYPTLSAFHDRYLEVVASPELSAGYLADLVEQRTDPDWMFAATELLEALADLEEDQRRVELAKAELRAMANGRTTKGGGVHVIWPSKPSKGTINTRKLHEEFGITDADLDRFRGPETPAEERTPTVKTIKSKSDD